MVVITLRRHGYWRDTQAKLFSQDACSCSEFLLTCSEIAHSLTVELVDNKQGVDRGDKTIGICIDIADEIRRVYSSSIRIQVVDDKQYVRRRNKAIAIGVVCMPRIGRND